jgi:hypothetical protein
MKFHPFDQETQGSLGEGTSDETRLDLDQYLLILVPRMEVRRVMIAVVHVHDDSVETAHYRRVTLPFPALGIHQAVKGSVDPGGGHFHVQMGKI